MPKVIVAKLVSGVTDHFITRLPEWIWSIILLNFGVTLLGSSDTFEGNVNFSVMERMAGENTWGWFLTVIGGLRLLSLVINGTFKPLCVWTPHARALGATFSCFAWFLIALGIFLANPAATGWKTYAGLLIGDMIVAVVVAGEAARALRAGRLKNGCT
jgi:hypothetical protein